MTEDRIEGRVAQILTERELVINKGSDDGVEVGMRFAILNRRGADITDPESGEVLGSVELPKTLVKIVRVHERLAVGRTFRTVRTSGGPMWNPFGESLTRPPRNVAETLRTEERSLKEELDPRESYVKIGDPAVEAVGDEFEDQA